MATRLGILGVGEVGLLVGWVVDSIVLVRVRNVLSEGLRDVGLGLRWIML